MSRVFFLLLPMLKNVDSQIGQGSQNGPNLTVAQCAALPFKYVQVRSYSGAVIVCNVAADKIKNRDKIKSNPDLKTIWYSYREATLNELINYRAISN